VQRAVVVCRERVIQVGDLGLDMGPAKGSTMEEIVTLEELERRYIREVLEKTRGVIKGPEGAAALLGLPASTLYFRMKKLGIERK
jgi:DNA-binding NtrC family response regulator